MAYFLVGATSSTNNLSLEQTQTNIFRLSKRKIPHK